MLDSAPLLRTAQYKTRIFTELVPNFILSSSDPFAFVSFRFAAALSRDVFLVP